MQLAPTIQTEFEQVIQFSADFEQVVQCRRLKPLAEPLGCTAMFIRHAIALVVHHHMAVVTPDHVLHPTTIIQPPQTSNLKQHQTATSLK